MFEELPKCFPKRLYYFVVLPTTCEDSPHCHQHLLFSVLLIIVTLGCVNRFLIVFICSFSNDWSCLFMWLIGHCMFSLGKYLFKPVVHLRITIVVFLLFSSKSVLYIWDTRPLSYIWFANIFSHCLCFVIMSERLSNQVSWRFTSIFLFKLYNFSFYI